MAWPEHIPLVQSKMDIIFTAALIFALGHLLFGVILWLRVRRFYSLPGHFGFPVFGNLYYFYRTLFLSSSKGYQSYFSEIAKKYGKNGICFHYGYGSGLMVFVTCPHITKKLAYHPNLKDKSDYGYQGFTALLGELFSRTRSDGEWKIRRKEYNVALNRTAVRNNYFNRFLKSADTLANILLALSSDVDVHSAVLSNTMNVNIATLIGLETNLPYDPKVIHDTDWLFSRTTVIGSFPRLMKIILTILRTVNERIYLGRLLDLRKQIALHIDSNMDKFNQSISSENTEFPLAMHVASRTRNDKWTFINELHEIIVTSTHTVAAVLTNALIYLAILPEVQERAWEEQYDIFGNDSRDPTIGDLNQMNFLDRFIKETIRFSCPLFAAKKATGNIDIDGITIPNGANVGFLSIYMSKDPKYWENPECFDPDRFLVESETLQYSNLSFGLGIRNCPGGNYALDLIKITLSKILRRTILSPVLNIKFEDLTFLPQLLTEIKNPPLLRVKERV